MLKQAFVAMKFTKPHSKDPVYARIRNVLAEAGYKAIRSDEVPTSGAAVDEVCRYLREADLVVIDSTGDSHSVSYEVGYCHGANRPPESTVLLRKDSEIPFNYRHYRHRCYGTPRGLERELRQFLGISEPISKSALARVVSFEFSSLPDDVSDSLAKLVIEAAGEFSLTGRLELYTHDGYIHVNSTSIATEVATMKTPNDNTHLFRLGVTFRPRGKNWEIDLRDFTDLISSKVVRAMPGFCEAPTLSDFGSVGYMCKSVQRFSFCDFENGQVNRALYPLSNPLARYAPCK